MGDFFLHLPNEEKLNVKWKQQIKWPDTLPVSIRLKMDLSYLELILIYLLLVGCKILKIPV